MNLRILPDKLYGRKKEIKHLNGLFNRICSGEGILLSVPGPSGIGKTSLVNELKKPVQKQNGIFISGKFEQYQQNIPYFAIQQAFTRFAWEIDVTDNVTRSKLINRIKSELGSQGKVLTDFIPEFEKLIGKQPDLVEVSPQEARHRFFNIIRNFLKAVCLPEHPVVFFIDDWQWADFASLELIKNLGIGSELRYLLMAVSYRDNEVSENSLLLSTLDEIRQREDSLEELKVGFISTSDVSDLVKDGFPPKLENPGQLTDLVYRSTQGNPYFVISLLEYLVEIGFIAFSKTEKAWKWSTEEKNKTLIPSDIIELFRNKLKNYNEDVRHLISLASCLGNSFNLNDLSIISGREKDEVKEMLDFMVKQGIIQRLNKSNEQLENTPGDMSLVFRHDRLQQAAYSFISQEELPSLLLKIGRILLEKLPPDQLELNLFEVVVKINAGIELIEGQQELLELVHLNTRAAGKAFASTAYAASLKFFHSAGKIIERNSMDLYLWENEYDAYLNYYVDWAESEFLEGNFSIAEKCLDIAIANAHTPIEKADIYNNLIVQLTLQSRYAEAINKGREALNLLGIFLPDKDFETAMDKEIKEVYGLLQDKNIAALASLPHMENPEMLRATKLLITMGPPCYRSHQRLWSVLVPIVVQLSLKYGNIPQAGYSHTAFAGLLIWVGRDYDTARKFSDLATDLMDNQFRSPSHLSVFYLMIGSSCRHWFEPMYNGSKDYLEAYEIGLRSGNLQYAAYAFGHNMYCQFFQGMNLPNLIEETERSLSFVNSRHNQWATDLFEGGLQVFHSLSDATFFYTGNEMADDKQYLEVLEKHHNIQVQCIYNIVRVYSLFICGRMEEALQLSRQTDSILYTVGTQGLLPWPEHVFLRYLLITGLYPQSNAEDQKNMLNEAEEILVDLKKWADVSPHNFRHKYFLALAEMAKLKGEIEAFDFYEKAIKAARKDKFVQWEAIANERAAKYWRETENENFAYNYWENAYVCYEQWGANAKLNLMKEEYSKLFDGKVNLSGFKGFGEKRKESLKQQMLDKQLIRLDNYAQQAKKLKLKEDTARYAEEITSAAKRLREEIKVRKVAETALRESEEMFHSLFSNMSEGVALHEFVFDGEKPVNYRIIDVNASYLNIVGMKKENIVGKLVTEAYRIKEPLYLKKYSSVFKTQKAEYFETYSEQMDMHFGVSVIPWRSNGFATIFSDISFRVRNEERVRLKNEELQKINQEKDKFFSIIGHDLKGPLGSIKSLSEIFVEQIREHDINWIENYARVISSSISHSEALLTNLIEWSRSQTGRMDFNPETINLNALLEEIIALFELASGEKVIGIDSTIAPDTLIYGDRAMIETVLRNLISNALKFSNPDSEIHLRAEKRIDEVEISVSDSGVGMKPADLERLFRLDESFSTRGTNNEKGTGLGLILCKEFVEKHKGKIWAESELGKGTVISFTLPDRKAGDVVSEKAQLDSDRN